MCVCGQQSKRENWVKDIFVQKIDQAGSATIFNWWKWVFFLFEQTFDCFGDGMSFDRRERYEWILWLCAQGVTALEGGRVVEQKLSAESWVVSGVHLSELSSNRGHSHKYKNVYALSHNIIHMFVCEFRCSIRAGGVKLAQPGVWEASPKKRLAAENLVTIRGDGACSKTVGSHSRQRLPIESQCPGP